MHHKFAFLPFVLLLAACAQLGLAPASTLTERLAYAYGTHTAVLQATTSSLDAGDIKSEDAERILKIADQSRQALDAAKLAIGAGDTQTAEGRLQLATAILIELQAYLRRKA